MSDTVKPFRIEVADEVLVDLRERLARTRWPGQITDAGWDYGTELGYLQELCEYWRTSFDWRAAEAELNAWPNFLTEIDGQRIHFIHARSRHDDAFPIVITHGWPGSVSEFLKILGPLTDPEAHGGSAADAFHVVCPSMPGYGWSGPTSARGCDVRRVAEANATLMARLGYARYGAQGGDWGSFVSTHAATIDSEHVAGIHLNFAIAGPPQGADPMEGLTDEERQDMAGGTGFAAEETGYQQIQGTKPQTLAYGLTDSPAGLAGWIVEKFRTWSDCDGDVERRFTKDELLTNISIYWVTGTIGSSVRMYYETRRSGSYGGGFVSTPTGVAIFPKELIRPPRKWVEARYNLTHWTRMPRGGHFAAMEEPGLLAGDIRSFFRPLR